MESIWLPVIVTPCYLGFIYFGNNYMKPRQSFSLEKSMILYNLAQIICNGYIVIQMLYELYRRNLPFWGNSYLKDDPEEYMLSLCIYLHYLTKYLELLDTVFMVLRKKIQQISFLHVYHHALMFWAWYVVCKTECGGDAYFGACVNSFIHVIMYSYYLSALFKWPFPFKKYITRMQMAQFVIVSIHSLYVLYHGHMSTFLASFQLSVMISMLILFSQFYTSKYKH